MHTYIFLDMDDASNQLYLFIKENKKVRKQENTLSTKKAIKKTRKKERKQVLNQEIYQEKKKTRTRPRK